MIFGIGYEPSCFFSDGSTINWVYGGYYTETGWVKLNNGDLLLII